MLQISTSPVVGALTGRARGRLGLFGRVIMQVEKYRPIAKWRYPNPPKMSIYVEGDLETYWTDASSDDILSNLLIFQMADV